jgi:hypothetical protein
MGWFFIGVSVSAILGVCIAAIVAPHSVPISAVLVVVGIAMVFAWLYYRATIVPTLICTSHSLTVINPWSRRVISLFEIDKIVPGYSGLRIHLKNDSVINAWAVQKSNWAQWRAKRGRADDVAHVLAVRIAAATGSQTESIEPTIDERRTMSKSAGTTMAIGLIGLVVYAVVRIALS